MGFSSQCSMFTVLVTVIVVVLDGSSLVCSMANHNSMVTWPPGLWPLMPPGLMRSAVVSPVSTTTTATPHVNLYSWSNTVGADNTVTHQPLSPPPPLSEVSEPSTIKTATLADVPYIARGSNRYVPVISTRVVTKRDHHQQPNADPGADSNRFMPENEHHSHAHSALDPFDGSLDTFLRTLQLGSNGLSSVVTRPQSPTPHRWSSKPVVSTATTTTTTTTAHDDHNLDDIFQMDDLEVFNGLDLF